MKKYLLFLMAIMLATVARAGVGETFTFKGLNYIVLSEADHTAAVGRNGDASGEVTIPFFVTRNGSRYIVTSIGESAFWYCSSLTSVTIPNSVTSIGGFAFDDCSSLTSVTIPNSVTSIGSYAFSDCSSLTSVTIPNSVTSIGNEAFSFCRSLTSVTIPNSVTSIGDGPFAGCTNLNEIIVEDGNEYYCSDNGVLYNYKKTRLIQCPGAKTEFEFPTSVTSIGYRAFFDCSSLTSVTIPNSVTSIGESAFWYCSSLTSVTIPNSVTSIGYRAFFDCSSLTSVTIPNSVTSIGDGTFGGCTNLNEIIVEDGNEYYCSDNGVLYDYNKTSLIQCPGAKTEIEIPNSVTSIGNEAFYGCRSLTSVTIPNSVTSIGYQAFYDCRSLTSVTIPNSVTSIGSDAFSGCSSLTSVTIPNSVTSIGSDAFSGCSSLTSVTIPNSVTSIGYNAFERCSSLTSVTIPNSVTSIGSGTFLYCSSLTSVTIPNSVTEIDNYAFNGCRNLRTIIDLNPTPQKVYNRAFEGVPSDAVVYVPKGSYMTYMLADGWTQFSDFREMGAFDITISASTLELTPGKTAELTVTVVKDDDVTVGDHKWVSSNPEVATVEDGKVTAVAPGTADITYTIYDGYGVAHSESCTVTVKPSSGVQNIVDNASAAADVFNLNGYQVLRNATEAEINALPAGIYIVRQGKTAKKIAVK